MGRAGIGRQKERGTTTLELLVFTAISMFLLAGVYDAYRNFYTGMVRTQAKARAQDNARRVLEQTLRELRMAGYGMTAVVAPVPLSAITAAAGDSVTLLTNDNPLLTTLTTTATAGSTSLTVASTSGFQINDAIYVANGATVHAATVTGVGASLTITPPLTADFGVGATVERQPRQITYAYSGGILYRDSGDGLGLQPVLTDVSSLSFSYFDGSNNPVLMPGGDVTTIRRVEVDMTASASELAPFGQGFTVTSDAWIRN
ncbi:MAG: PilW family protein [Candidatus Methylomirabilales bacterium]